MLEKASWHPSQPGDPEGSFLEDPVRGLPHLKRHGRKRLVQETPMLD
jgi:hypothetical protein